MVFKIELTARHKVAALLLAIDQDLAANVLKHMGDDEVELVTQAMKQLEEMAVEEADIHDVFKETVGRLRRGGIALGDVGGLFKGLVRKAFGDDRGTELLDNVEKHTLASRPFAMFEQVPPEELAALLSEEHPQITSVFLAHLDSELAGAVVSALPEDLRGDVLYRISSLRRSSPDVVQRIVEALRSRVRELGLPTSRAAPNTFLKKAADILNRLGGDKTILDEITQRDEDIGHELREELFTFDDLAKLDRKSTQKILAAIDTGVLALAMRACSKPVEENLFTNLSKRARDMVADERDASGPVPLSEVLEAQRQILEEVRGLIESGEVMPAGAGGEELV